MDQAHALGIPVFMKEDLVPIMGEETWCRSRLQPSAKY